MARRSWVRRDASYVRTTVLRHIIREARALQLVRTKAIEASRTTPLCAGPRGLLRLEHHLALAGLGLGLGVHLHLILRVVGRVRARKQADVRGLVRKEAHVRRLRLRRRLLLELWIHVEHVLLELMWHALRSQHILATIHLRRGGRVVKRKG